MLKGAVARSRRFALCPQIRKTMGVHKKKGRLRCHKRPKSREETPKEGSDSRMGLGALPHTRS
jgi:hypothetical protein